MNSETANKLAQRMSERFGGYVCVVKIDDNYDVIVNNPNTAKQMGHTVVNVYYNGEAV